MAFKLLDLDFGRTHTSGIEIGVTYGIIFLSESAHRKLILEQYLQCHSLKHWATVRVIVFESPTTYTLFTFAMLLQVNWNVTQLFEDQGMM